MAESKIKEEDIRPKEIFNRYLEICRKDIKIFFGDKSKYKSVACPACQSSSSRESFIKDGFTYVICGRCSTIYNTPRPDHKSIVSYYRDSDSTRYWASTFYKETEKNRRVKLFRPKARLVKSLIKKHGIPNESLLEVGAGYGTFCEELIRAGAAGKCVALEPSMHLAAACRTKGIEVIESTIEGVDKKYFHKFSVATSLELFEHLYSIDDFMQAVKKVLVPGGYFIFSTLNGMGWDILNLKKYSKSVSPPHHLNFLNPESIALLCERLGWRLAEVFTPGKLDVDIVRNIALENKKVKLDAFSGFIIRQDEGTRNNFQAFLSANRLSSHMWVVLQKK